MEARLLACIDQLEAAARHCRACHRSRRDGYEGLTLNEHHALAELVAAVAALEREDSFPNIGTAA
jgi:hypothetical protein